MDIKLNKEESRVIVIAPPLGNAKEGRGIQTGQWWFGIAATTLIAAALFTFIILRRYERTPDSIRSWTGERVAIATGFRYLSEWSISRKQWLYDSSSSAANWIITGIRLLLFLCVVAAIVYYMIAFVAGLLWFADRRRQRGLNRDYTPPATIFKPVRGVDAQAYENFASFCRQEYPSYQLIFGVRDDADPAIPIIKRVMADFPDHDIDLVISAGTIGPNAKVSNLQNMDRRAKHQILLIADSDIRVTPDYLRRVVAPLQREQIGMVTCLYRGVNATTFAGLIENIGVSSTFAPEVCTSRALEGVAFAFGSTIVMRRELLERVGGFPAIADYLADDFILGNRAAREGYEVVISDYIVEHVAGPITLRAMLKHQLRWGRSTRISRPWGYRGLILTYGTVTALLSLIAWNFSGVAWLLLGATTIARFMPVFLIGVYGLRDWTLARNFWLTPIRDLITFGIWIYSFVGDEIEWRGARFRVSPDGRIKAIDISSASVEPLYSTVE